MKILCIADEEDKGYWDYFRKEKLADIDLILSSGDLRADYLTFLVTMGHAPLFYVHGNHDGGYATRPPEGCDCIEDKVVTYRGLRILGLGGCLRYRPGPHQYTERQMQLRILRRWWQLRKGVDIVVTHAPVRGYGDLPNRTHEGFGCFLRLIERYRPKYLLHGHVHLRYYRNLQRVLHCGETTIINVGSTYVLEIPDPPAQTGRRKRGKRGN